MGKTDHLFIVGAGFSRYAGLPLTNDFTMKLLDVAQFQEGGPSALTVRFLRQFVYDVFDHKTEAAAAVWPQLEDIFTLIDLSANTGHHLGPKYSPSDLRTVRRALIVRIIRMLRQTYTKAKRQRAEKWQSLETFFSMIDPDRCAFISMNWDTVIEQGMYKQKVKEFDYGCDAKHIEFDEASLRRADSKSKKSLQVIKIHGSANWLYCDACRTTFWVDPDSTLNVADQLFRDTDWKTVEKHIGEAYKYVGKWQALACPLCSAQALGTRFATFSYRKALDFPMYEQSWLTVARLLREASTWTFIGYSLPPADYEFKHLLKYVQLTRSTPPHLVLISGGAGAHETQKSYQKFFGPQLRASAVSYFKDGFSTEAIDHLKSIGALVPP
jgi:hypothetical protein